MAETFSEYLDRYRGRADVLAGAALTDALVLGYVQGQDIQQHGASVAYQFIGNDAPGGVAGDPVYRLGTLIFLQDIQAHLDALVVAHSISKIPGAATAYSCNPSLRK
jgi:hypothetical protein